MALKEFLINLAELLDEHDKLVNTSPMDFLGKDDSLEGAEENDVSQHFDTQNSFSLIVAKSRLTQNLKELSAHLRGCKQQYFSLTDLIYTTQKIAEIHALIEEIYINFYPESLDG